MPSDLSAACGGAFYAWLRGGRPLISEVIRWPNSTTRWQLRLRHPKKEIFKDCIGFLDGTGIVFRDRPMLDVQ